MGSIPRRVKPLSSQHSGVRAKTGWVRIGIMCPSRATGLHTDSCFSELALTKIQLSLMFKYKADIIIISSNVAWFHNNIAEKWLIWH